MVRVIDYGSGSGVLAICALKSGATHATATDCDALAVEMSRKNAELNGVGSRLDALLVPASGGGPPPGDNFDILVGNILQQPLMTLRGLFASLVRPGGRLALSGILEDQAQDVLEAYSGDFCSLEEKMK
jgi:ribosomal protein L11 methyltransferase